MYRTFRLLLSLPFVFACVKQTKLYELEGQVRRGAAERGAAETKKNEFQEEIQRQKEQISHIESLYKRQLEGSQNICSQEKVHTNTTGSLNGDKMQQGQITHYKLLPQGNFGALICSLFIKENIQTVKKRRVFASRAHCSRTFPPVPKPYRNSKVNIALH